MELDIDEVGILRDSLLTIAENYSLVDSEENLLRKCREYIEDNKED